MLDFSERHVLLLIFLTPFSLPLNDVPQAKKRRVSKYSRKGYEEDGPVHATGCARSEGYYKIDMRDKIKYLPHHKDSMFVTHTDATTASKQKTQVRREAIYVWDLLLILTLLHSFY